MTPRPVYDKIKGVFHLLQIAVKIKNIFEVHRQEMIRIDKPRHFLLRLAKLTILSKSIDGEAKNLSGIPKG